MVDYYIGALPTERSSGVALQFDCRITLNPTGYPTIPPQGQAKKVGYGHLFLWYSYHHIREKE